MKTLLPPLLLALFSIFSAKQANACHAIALVNSTSQTITGGIQVTASSDSPTCGCDVYWLDVEVRCAGEAFNGSAFSPGFHGPLATYPFFQSAQMNKPNCVVQQYPWVTISYSGLCPGTTYQYRMRENHNGQVGPWTATSTFTVPGTMPTLTGNVTATDSTLCSGQCATLTATASGGCNLALLYQWNTGATTPTLNVCPTTTTTYTATITEQCSNQSVTQSITIIADPTPVSGTLVASQTNICSGQTTTMTLSGSVGVIQWQSSPGTTGPWTNISGTTATTYNSPPLTTNTCYRAELTGCGTTLYTTPQCITVNPNPTISVNPAVQTICEGQSTTLVASGALGYTWTPATGLNTTTGTTVQASPATTTTYSVTGTTAAGCSATTTATISVTPLPTLSLLPQNPGICSGDSVPLTASGATTYTWSPATGLSGSGPNVTASPSVTTVYSVTGTTSGCSSTESTTVTVTNAASAIVSPSSDTICNGGSVVFTATGSNSWTWSPATGLSSTTGSTVTATPTTTTTYSVLGDNGAGCTATTSVTVTVNPLPIVSVTPAAPSVCAGSGTTLTASGANTYTWSPSTGLSGTSGASVIATPTATTTYTVTGLAATGCTSTTTVTVTVNPLPQMAVSPPSSSICNGSSVTLTASGAGVGGTYNWSPSSGLFPSNTATVTTNPGSTTTYTVIGQTAAGCSNTATATVTVNANPVMSVTPSSPTACNGNPINLTASGAGTGGTYSWTPATGLSSTTGASVTATPTTTTTYTVTGTNSAGCTGSTTVTAVIFNNPVVTVTPATSSVCQGNGVTLTANGASTYSWSPAAGLSSTTGTFVTASPSATSTYTVTGTDANGCSSTATATVTVNPLPVLSVSPSAPVICAGANVQLCASGANSYTWGPSSGISTTVGQCVNASPSTTTTYTVMGMDGNGCVNAVQVPVTVNPLPTITVSPASPAICAGGSTPLTASGAGTGSYVWTPAAGLNNPTASSVIASPASTTNYTVTGINANGCAGTASVTLTVNPLPVVTVQASPGTICNGTSTTLTATGATTYSWTGPALSSTTGNNVSATPSTSTTYTVIGSNVFGCTDSVNTNITVNPLPGLTVSANPNPVCIGQSSTLTATGGNSYSWSTGATGAAISVSPVVTTSYTVTATGVGGCTKTENVTVTVHDSLNVMASGSTSICFGKSAQISSIASGGNGGPYYYSWSPGNMATKDVTVTPSTTTTYTVTASDNCGTPPVTAQVIVTVDPLPVADFVSDTTEGCYPVTVNFTNNSNTTYDCLWDFGDGTFDSNCNPSHTFSQPGTYPVTLTVTDEKGCSKTTEPHNIVAYDYPVAQFLFGPQPTTIINPVITFDASPSSPDVTGWYWQFDTLGVSGGKPDTEFAFHESGSYPVTLTVRNKNGCTNAITHEVVIGPDYTLYIPNAFSPNGDGLNDTWGPESVGLNEIKGYVLKIFNRWGEMIYSTKDPFDRWDGKPVGGSGQYPQDVYIYVIDIKDKDYKHNQHQGHVSLLR